MNRTLERLPAPIIPGQRLPQAILHFYDVVVSFDYRHDRCWIVSSGWPEQDPARRSERARRRADEFASMLASQKSPRNDSPSTVGAWNSNFSREGYIAAVQRVIDLILAAVIIVGLPVSAVWALGLLVGINMVFGGTALIGMALHAREA